MDVHSFSTCYNFFFVILSQQQIFQRKHISLHGEEPLNFDVGNRVLCQKVEKRWMCSRVKMARRMKLNMEVGNNVC